jgi:uncharacterized membrane protein
MRSTFSQSETLPGEQLPSINWWALLGPLFAGLALIGLILLFSIELTGFYLSMFGASIVGGGKFVILAALDPENLLSFLGIKSEMVITPYMIMYTVMYIEFAQGIMFLYNVDIVKRIKFVRKKLNQVRLAAQRMFEKWPIVQKLSFATLITFVALPFTGTGAMGGVVFSSVLGLKKTKTLIGILIGSILGNLFLAVGVDIFQESFANIMKNPIVMVSVLVIIVAFIWVLNVLIVKAMKELAEEARKQKALAAVARTVNITTFNMKRVDLRVMLDESLTNI